MIPLIAALKVCLGLFIYYLVFFIVDAVKKGSRATNTPNRTITELRTKYGITIKTFNRNGDRRDGFSWIKSIWINERVFKDSNRLRFVFFHEKYHLDHKHKVKLLLMRFGIVLIPLLLSVVHWIIVIIIFTFLAMVVQYITDKVFEKKANEYAKQMMNE